jgi:putative FmdB family regulatory protein
MRRGGCEQEMQGSAAAFFEHDVEQLAERTAADEECERLVLVRRPRPQSREQKRADRRREREHAETETAEAAASLLAMPIYEYRCPNGHVFEVFQRMADSPPESCETCGEGPVERVLFPVAVHFKGSGFYSTDYGRSRKSKKEGDSGAGAGEASSDKAEKKTEKAAD